MTINADGASSEVKFQINGVEKASIDSSGNLAVSGAITGGTDLAVADGGTGASDASTARTNLGVDTTASSTTTFTNKTFDANGTGNSLSNVDVADLADGTDGEIITWDASGNPATVAVGTSGQVLTSNGTGAAPTMQAGGKVLQVVFANTSTQHNTGGGYSDTGLSASITPSSSSNKVLVIVSQPMTFTSDTSAARYSEVKTLRGTTLIEQSRQNWDIYRGSHTSTNWTHSISDLDTPATTATTTYKTQFMVSGGSCDIYAQKGGNSDSQMILMEIVG